MGLYRWSTLVNILIKIALVNSIFVNGFIMRQNNKLNNNGILRY